MMKTPAKINLFLKVTGRCENSYHSLRTLFLPLDAPSDEIKIDFTAAPGISISCALPGVPSDERNLCWKAASGYAAAAEINPNWQITVNKNIPVAAGMGGGSSDAAAVLRTLNEHYRKLGDAELAAAALRCGADVPFFLSPRLALASGVGDILEYPEIDFPEIPLLLINPGFPISAAWAYRNLARENIGELPAEFERKILNALQHAELEKLSALIFNDLSPACYKKFPLLKTLKSELLKTGAAAAEITGSGPTVFALCGTFAKLDELAAHFCKKYPQMTVIKSKLKNNLACSA
ncbi:MAG: 4-(cytidine 5'-diphospho)-2-C-methyl-D-erythritol kinase [Victivallaceae bacterium]|nr:4-(cytidine 5'-diphospho)-2-C-methyl-D-erythritol kinase [Victivallaceae bacterium]